MGHLYVAQGDLTLLSADAIAYSTDRALSVGGQLTSAFEANLPTFRAQYAALSKEHGPRRPEPGSAFWLPMSGDKPRGVVVTIATGSKLARVVRAYAAVQGALACAAKNLAEAKVKKPWLIALPAFLTGDGGARHDRLLVAEPQIEAARAFLSTHDDVDVAFVPYTEATYQVYLEARRLVLSRTRPSRPSSIEPPQALVDALRCGECVLFVGSGVSAGSGLPGWSSLIEELADDLGIDRAARRDDLDYFLDLAQWYRDERRKPPLSQRIQRRFSVASSGARPTLSHYLLTSLPIRYVVTTNYDDLLETSLEALRRHPVRVVTERDVANTGGADGCYVVKFHGDAVTRRAIVLSRDDYDGFFRKRPAMALLLEGLLLNQSFFFVGYGLRDPDFRQIYHRIAFMLRGAKRPAFATTFDAPTDHPKKQWRNKHLELIDVPGESFGDKTRALDLFLDRLAERVAEDPQLFLADDVERPLAEHVQKVREQLLSTTPSLVAAALHGAQASPSEIRALAEVLRFLASRGWRGDHAGQLGVLFAALAAHPGLSETEQKNLLVSALRYTESSREAKRLRDAIERRETRGKLGRPRD